MAEGWSVQVTHHGLERQPVLIIDRFAPAPERFVDDACFLRFEAVSPHYPGLRAPVPPALLRDLLTALAGPIRAVFGVAAFETIDAYYSLVTTIPARLSLIQRLPHFDGVEPERLALLHYLSRDTRGGTAFYRHRTTGYETVDAARFDRYRATLDTDVKREGVPEPGYIGGDTPIFEQIARYEAVYNRAIVYRGNTLHCAAIPPDMLLSEHPASGRLTVNTFLKATPRG